MDVAHAISLVDKLKKFADENKIILRYEAIKDDIRRHYKEASLKYNFFRPFKTDKPLHEFLKDMLDNIDIHKK